MASVTEALNGVLVEEVWIVRSRDWFDVVDVRRSSYSAEPNTLAMFWVGTVDAVAACGIFREEPTSELAPEV
jgi:hypothetical protein